MSSQKKQSVNSTKDSMETRLSFELLKLDQDVFAVAILDFDGKIVAYVAKEFLAKELPIVEVANAAVLIASDYASALTAMTINASCGKTVDWCYNEKGYSSPGSLEVLDIVEPIGTKGTIDARETITEITVDNIQKSKEWYSRLFGKGPDLEPFPGNIEFKIGGAWVQIVEGEVRPSSWTILFEVRDLARERERLREEGIPATEIKASPKVISWFDLKDPDGNAMRWFQVLTTDTKVTGVRD